MAGLSSPSNIWLEVKTPSIPERPSDVGLRPYGAPDDYQEPARVDFEAFVIAGAAGLVAGPASLMIRRAAPEAALA